MQQGQKFFSSESVVDGVMEIQQRRQTRFDRQWHQTRANRAVPLSRSLNLIGRSPSAGAVLTVIIDPHDGSGVTAWIARGADLRLYLQKGVPS